MAKALSKSGIITYDELQAATDKAAFCADAVARYMATPMYRDAVTADEYMRQRNPTVKNFVQMLYNVDGREFRDVTASSIRMASNLFFRLNTQRCMYSLGKGVSFAGEKGTKGKLGDRFDDDVKRIGICSLVHGIAFPFWNKDHIDVFEATEFCPVWDAESGALMAGIRFWRLDAHHQLNAVLYEQDGYTRFKAPSAESTDLKEAEPKRGYVVTYSEVPADGLKLAVNEENYSRLPIIPVWGSDRHQSTLVGMRADIDAYDLIKSGLANDSLDCAQIYWIISGAGGMQDEELAAFRDKLRLMHIASVVDGDEVSVTPYTQEVPYDARKAVLEQIKADLYEGFGALDVHTVAAGATNDHIDAAYQPMDEEADAFERHMREGIMDILALQGIEDTPVFTRNRVSNVKEQVETIAIEAEWLDEETVLRKLPNVTPDEVEEILARKEEAEAARMSALPPELAANALAAMNGEQPEAGEGDDGEPVAVPRGVKVKNG